MSEPLANPEIRPYKDLYIYYLDGVLDKKTSIRTQGFIGNWEEDGYSFLFFETPSDDLVDEIIKAVPGLSLIDAYKMTWEEWLGGEVAPFSSGVFHIVPPWPPWTAAYAPDIFSSGMSGGKNGDEHTIWLHPGVVFGTGTHPTTGDCLKAVQIAIKEGRPETALDLGTGTGILSLAAAKLGGMKVLAVDLNLLAAKTASKNIRLNALDTEVLSLQGNALQFIGMSADMLIANIHYDVMKHLLTDKGFLTKKQFILSGLLRSEAKKVLKTLEGLPVTIKRTWETDGVWHTIYGSADPI